jgi:hypothetical protein
VKWKQRGRDSSDLRCRGEYRRSCEKKTDSGDGPAELLHASPLNVNIAAAIPATALSSLAAACHQARGHVFQVTVGSLSTERRISLVLYGTAARVTDPQTLEQVAAGYRAGGWPAQVDGDAFTAPLSAPAPGRRRGTCTGARAHLGTFGS